MVAGGRRWPESPDQGFLPNRVLFQGGKLGLMCLLYLFIDPSACCPAMQRARMGGGNP